jgi:hypothetical protein
MTKRDGETNIRFLVSCSSEAVPYLFSMEEDGVHNCSGQSCEAKTVVESESWCQKHRRVFLVLRQIKGEVWTEDAGDVVRALGIVESLRRIHGKIVRVPRSIVCDPDSSKYHKHNQSDKGIDVRMDWREQRVQEITRDVRPVECQWYQTHTGKAAK